MAFVKLDNPKPSAAGSLGPDHVKLSAREGPHKTRFITIHIGKEVARKASFTQPQHKAHLHKGSGHDAGKMAVELDDSSGTFTAKQQKNGTYKISMGSVAAEAAGLLTTFPPFTRGGLARQMESGKARFIVFDLTPEIQGFRGV
jgi:hypothetical protein